MRKFTPRLAAPAAISAPFAVQHDLLRHKPDLVFVEFAVNDFHTPPERIWPAMEGIVRQIWAADPRTDICFVYTLVQKMTEILIEGECPSSISADEMLAEHYGIPSINVALRIAELAAEGKLIVQPDAGVSAEDAAAQAAADGKILFSQDGCHPLEAGHAIYTEVIAAAIEQMQASKPINHAEKLSEPFVENHWQAAQFVPIEPAMLTGSWRPLPPDAELSEKFANRLGTIYEAVEPGDKLTIRFRGSLVKLYDLLGPDGGQVMITVDGKTRGPVPRFDSFCTYHRLATLHLAANLDPQAVHELTVELLAAQPDRSVVTDKIKDQPDFDPQKYDGTRLRVGGVLILGELVE